MFVTGDHVTLGPLGPNLRFVCTSAYTIHTFFYKDNFIRTMSLRQICPKIKDNLRTIPGSFLTKKLIENAKSTSIENMMLPYQHTKSKVPLPYIF